MKMLKPCHGLGFYADEPPHSIVHELTFFVQDEDGRFTRHDEVHERTYEILTYDILLEQAGFKNVKVYADFKDKEPTDKSARWFFQRRNEMTVTSIIASLILFIMGTGICWSGLLG